jgi:hypothetical protein
LPALYIGCVAPQDGTIRGSGVIAFVPDEISAPAAAVDIGPGPGPGGRFPESAEFFFLRDGRMNWAHGGFDLILIFFPISLCVVAVRSSGVTASCFASSPSLDRESW